MPWEGLTSAQTGWRYLLNNYQQQQLRLRYTVAVKSVTLYPQAQNSVHVKGDSSHSAIILPQQQSYLSPLLQRLAAELQRPIQVLGWYHSHPHITVWPSHVGKCIYQVYRNRHRPCCFQDWTVAPWCIQHVWYYMYVNLTVSSNLHEFINVLIQQLK